ncbi:hypothetical protein [Acetobacter indonesiensis]|uniref:Uncharacterized protein n=1 Tax=Acetobacter indonesiensis TaxID=104101 RepID=A0A252ASD6_9PROT|nr:hypothetical protein [Acetobacter indonesiensis]OUI93158.1 hypothetical protein HK17_08445 [Acetobacter indonesiensis]
MTPTNWPNPERPGEPPNPEKDGLYAMRIDEKFIVRYWSTARQHYSLVQGWKKGMSPFDASVFTFCGEILTPEQINEMLAAARERAVSACQSQKEVFESPEYAGGPLGAVMERFACDRCIEEIRNLGAAP